MGREFIACRSLDIPRSGIRVMFDRALGVKGLVHLEAGEPDFRTPSYIVEAAKKAMDEGYTKYTANKGYIELRTSIARAKTVCTPTSSDDPVEARYQTQETGKETSE